MPTNGEAAYMGVYFTIHLYVVYIWKSPYQFLGFRVNIPTRKPAKGTSAASKLTGKLSPISTSFCFSSWSRKGNTVCWILNHVYVIPSQIITFFKTFKRQYPVLVIVSRSIWSEFWQIYIHHVAHTPNKIQTFATCQKAPLCLFPVTRPPSKAGTLLTSVSLISVACSWTLCKWTQYWFERTVFHHVMHSSHSWFLGFFIYV